MIMKSRRDARKDSWIVPLDKAPFDETFHELENLEEGVIFSETDRRLTFWFA